MSSCRRGQARDSCSRTRKTRGGHFRVGQKARRGSKDGYWELWQVSEQDAWMATDAINLKEKTGGGWRGR